MFTRHFNLYSIKDTRVSLSPPYKESLQCLCGLCLCRRCSLCGPLLLRSLSLLSSSSSLLSFSGSLYTFGDGRHGKLCLDTDTITNHFSPTFVQRFRGDASISAQTCFSSFSLSINVYILQDSVCQKQFVEGVTRWCLVFPFQVMSQHLLVLS